MALDNDWIRARDKAKKAGDLLSEVLKEKVQGERPLTMVGRVNQLLDIVCNTFNYIQVASSLGALALFRALLVLADSDKPAEPLIDSVILISLPQVVSPREWAKVRKVTVSVPLLDARANLRVKVVGRRIVNAYSSRDFVLAGVGRLHEVVSGAGFGGMAGLNAVEMHGVEDVDVSELVGGTLDNGAKLEEV